jgi:hypothetical protein
VVEEAEYLEARSGKVETVGGLGARNGRICSI